MSSLEEYDYTPQITAPEDYTKLYVHSIQPSTFTCAATQSYGIHTPPATNGLTPQVALSYNSHNTGELASIVGSGWGITQNYIQRDVNHTPDDTSDDEFILYLNGQQHKLVETEGTPGFIYVYKTRTDEHNRIEFYTTLPNSPNEKGWLWMVTEKDGTKHVFGESFDSEVMANGRDYVWRWYLTRTEDTHGNNIHYEYTEDDGVAYPHKIEYNNDRKRVIEFVLEDRPDVIPHYQQGSLVQYSKRINEIMVKIMVTADGSLVRKYLLEYETNNAQTKSYLTKITPVGADDITLPPAEYTYQNEEKGWEALPETWNPTPFWSDGYKRDASRLVDANNDGLVDIILAHAAGPDGHEVYSEAWINTGSGFSRDTNWDSPIRFAAGPYSTGHSTHEFPHAFGDANGDGRTDIITNGGTWVNTGSGWSWDTAYSPPVEPLSRNGVYTTDLNGDGLIDILQGLRSNDEITLKAWVNTGGGWIETLGYNPPTYFNYNYEDFFGSGWRFTRSSLRIADVNGDGLPDLLNETHAFLNNGNGWTQDNRYASPVPLGSSSGSRIADVNGDGLADALRSVLPGYGDPTKEVWINTGSGYTLDDGWSIPYFASGWAPITDGGAYFTDIDGEGIDEILEGNGRRGNKNQLKQGILVKTKNTFDGETAVEYTPSTGFDNTGGDGVSDLSQKMWCIQKITEDNKVAGAHAHTLETNYDFADGSYDPQEREFRGFRECVEEAGGEVVTHQVFHQDTARQGKQEGVETLDNAQNPYKLVEYGWGVSEFGGVYEVELESVTEYAYDGSYANPLQILTEYSYDAYGNLIETVYHGDVSVSGDEKREEREYVYNTGANIVNRVRRKALYGPNKESETYYSYDGGAYGSAPSKGDVTRIERWLNTGTNPVIEYAYDGYGNIITVTNPLGRTTSYVYAVTDSTHTFPERKINAKNQATEWRYDQGTGNLVSATDPNGYATTYAYDGFGRITAEVRPYDSPTHSTVAYEYEINETLPQAVKTMMRETAGAGTLDSAAYLDGFGRRIQLKGEAEDSKVKITQDMFFDGAGRAEKESVPHYSMLYLFRLHASDTIFSGEMYEGLMKVGEDELANRIGPYSRIDKTSYGWEIIGRDCGDGCWYTGINGRIDDNAPQETVTITFQELGLTLPKGAGDPDYTNVYSEKSYYTSPESVLYTLHELDPLGREKRTINPDGTEKTTVFDHGVETVTDENDHQKVYYKDGLGRITRVDEITDAGTYTTRYEYNARDSITRITNHEGDVNQYTFDSLGRKIQTSDPDFGVWTYAYDAVGNKIVADDSRDVAVNYAYDELNRITLEDYSSDGDVSYAYDAGVIGVLSSVSYPWGSKSFGYDQRLRKTSETIIIDGFSWATSWDFDSMDRVVSESRPNGIVVDYVYNTQGLLDGVSGVLSNADYNEYGKVSRKDLACGRSTDYSYYADDGRLERILAPNLLDVHYSYDGVGNVEGMADYIHGRNQAFSYDSLDRLVSAQSPDYSLSYAYSPIGNLVSLTDSGEVTELSYGKSGALPHAVTGVAGVGSGICDGVIPPLSGLWFINMPTICEGGEIVIYDGVLEISESLTLRDAAVQFREGGG